MADQERGGRCPHSTAEVIWMRPAGQTYQVQVQHRQHSLPQRSKSAEQHRQNAADMLPVGKEDM